MGRQSNRHAFLHFGLFAAGSYLIVFLGSDLDAKPLRPMIVGWRGSRELDALHIRGSRIVLKGAFGMSGDGTASSSGVSEVTCEIPDGKLTEIEGWWKRKKQYP